MRLYMRGLWSLLVGIISFMHVGCQQESPLANNIHSYIWANYLQFGGRMQQAQNWYALILRNDSSSCVRKGYIFLLYEAGNFKRILQEMQSMKTAYDNDQDVQLIFARALRQEGRKAEAESLIIKLSSALKKNMQYEIALEAIQVYVERKELTNALQLIDDILNNAPKRSNSFVFYFLKAQIQAQLGDYKNAYMSIASCVDCNPRFDKGWLLQGMIKEKEGDLQGAVKGYTSYLEVTDTPDQQIQNHLLELILHINKGYNKQVFRYREFFYCGLEYTDMLWPLLGRTYNTLYGLCGTSMVHAHAYGWSSLFS